MSLTNEFRLKQFHKSRFTFMQSDEFKAGFSIQTDCGYYAICWHFCWQIADFVDSSQQNPWERLTAHRWLIKDKPSESVMKYISATIPSTIRKLDGYSMILAKNKEKRGILPNRATQFNGWPHKRLFKLLWWFDLRWRCKRLSPKMFSHCGGRRCALAGAATSHAGFCELWDGLKHQVSP